MGKLDRVVAAAPHRSIRTGLTACGLAAALAVALPAGPAAAQSAGNGSVTVDYGALDGAPASAPLRPPTSYGPPPSTYPTPLSTGSVTGSGGMPAPGWYYYAGPGNLQGPFAQPPGGTSTKATATRTTTKKKTATKKPAKKPTQTAAAPQPQPAAQPEPAPAAPGTGNVALTPPPEPTEVNPPAPLQPVTPPPVAGGSGSQTPPAVASAPSASPTPEPAPAPAPAPAEQPAAAQPPAQPAPAPEPAPAAPAASAEPAPAPAPAPAPDGGGTQAAAPAPPPAPAPAADNGAAPTPPPAPAADQGGSQASGQTQTAALPPAAAPTGNEVRIEFPAESAEIPDTAKAALDKLAEQLGSDESERIQLLAYAAGSDDNASRARRMSLSRALAVRSYLIGKGVRSTRMDVRALGNNVQGSPPDRVDIIPQKS